MAFILGGGTAIGFEVGQKTLRAALVKRGGGRLRLDWKGERGLPEGTLTDSLTEPNITDMRAFREAVRGLARLSGYRGKTAGVALPDYVSRVAILDFDNLPGKKAETEQMLRWRLKKLLPFDSDQAALRHQYLGRFTVKDKEAHRFLTAIIKADILDQYERAFTDAGLRPVVMETASFAVWNLYHDAVAAGASGASNFALMNISGGKLTVMVFDRGVLQFMRLKDMGKFEHLEADGGGITVTKLLRELNASLTYYRENYADTPMGKVFLTGDFGQLDEMAVEIRESSTLDPVVLELSGAVQPGREAIKAGPALRPFSAACGAALEQ